MKPVAAQSGPAGDSDACIAIWRRQDKVREEQLRRLKSLELQASPEYGAKAWKEAHLLCAQLPDNARIDLPSAHVLGDVLGLFRTGALLKKKKILRLELSVEEIAQVLSYSKSTIEAALRWLDCSPIDYKGVQVARGIGVIHRGRRTGLGILHGIRRLIYRTSCLCLTMVGRILLGLPVEEQIKERTRRGRNRQHHRKPTTSNTSSTPPVSRNERSTAPPVEESSDPPNDDIARHFLQKIFSFCD